MSTPLALRAWVDESGSDHARDPGTYILAAAVVSTIEEDAVRTVMSSLRMSQRKVHWRDEGTRRRQAIIEAIANTCIEHIVVVRQRIPAERRTERARRKCLERLITELEARGIHELVLESRGPSDDQRDIDMLNAAYVKPRSASENAADRLRCRAMTSATTSSRMDAASASVFGRFCETSMRPRCRRSTARARIRAVRRARGACRAAAQVRASPHPAAP